MDNIALGEYNPEIAFPLVNASVTAKDLLNNFGDGTNLEEGTDKSLSFIYEGEGIGLRSEDITKLIIEIPIPMVDTVVGLPYNLPNNTFVDFVNIKKGIIGLFVSNNHAEPIEFTAIIPDITLNGVPFQRTITVGTLLPVIDTFHIPGHVLTPNEDSLHFYYRARLVNSGIDTTLYNSPDPIISLDSMRYSYAEGFLGNGYFPLDRDTIEIDFFNQFSGSVFFEEPAIQVTINNSFGFPVHGKFDILEANLTDGSIIPLTNATLNNGFAVDYPSFSEVGQSKQTSFTVDYTNSNINSIIGQPIAFFDYEIEAQANPNNSTQVGFLTDSSAISLDILVELPLYGKVQKFSISDTMAISLELYEKMDYANLKLITNNGFPIDVYTQLYFLDETYQEIDSLFTDFNESLLAAAPLGSNGRVAEQTEKISEIDLPEDRFDRLKQDAKFIRIKTSFSTINNGQESIRIYSDYELGVKLGIKAGISPFN